MRKYLNKKTIIAGLVLILIVIWVYAALHKKHTVTPNIPSPTGQSEAVQKAANPTQSVSGPNHTITNLNQLPLTQNDLGITADSYKITNVTYFENNTWAIVTVVPTTYEAQADSMIFAYDAPSNRWVQKTPPQEIFVSDIQGTVPASLYNYLVANHMLIVRYSGR